MAIVKTLNILKLFAFDTLMAAQGEFNLKEYMMRKHGWDETTYGNMKSTYLVALNLLNRIEEIDEIPDIDETNGMPIPGNLAKIKPGYLYEVRYPWGKGFRTGYGRITPKQFESGADGTMYILCKDGGVGFESSSDLNKIEIVREICRIDG